MSESNTAAVPLPIITPPSSSTQKGDTAYVLLSLTGHNQWMVEATVEARSAEAAIRSYFTDEKGDGADSVVAVPERSWKPVKVTVKTTTSLVIEEAT